jgi:CelD/BcsL family acetyltransferase involved in cellulose biosynthesis
VTQDVSTFFSLTIFSGGFESGDASSWSKSEGHFQGLQKAKPALPMVARTLMPRTNTTSEEKHPRVQVVRDLEQLSRYAPQWNELSARAPQRIPTNSYAWVSAYLEHRVDDEQRWVVLLAVDGEVLVGVLPLVVSPHSVFGLARPLLHTPHDSQIAACDVALVAGREQEVFELLFNAAVELFPKRFSIELKEIPSTSATLRVAEATGALLSQEFARGGTFFPIERSSEEFYASLRPGLRRNLKKANNRLRTLGKVKFEILEGESASEAELTRFASVEAASWKGAEGGAILSSQTRIDFYTVLARRLAKAGWLHWGFLSVDGKDLAASLSVKFQEKLFMWKSGYDAEYRNLSPFNVLLQHILQQAHSSADVDEIDPLSEVVWLDRWQASKRDYFNLAWYPRHPLSLALGYWPSRLRVLFRRSPLLTRLARDLQQKRAAISKARKWLHL